MRNLRGKVRGRRKNAKVSNEDIVVLSRNGKKLAAARSETGRGMPALKLIHLQF